MRRHPGVEVLLLDHAVEPHAVGETRDGFELYHPHGLPSGINLDFLMIEGRDPHAREEDAAVIRRCAGRVIGLEYARPNPDEIRSVQGDICGLLFYGGCELTPDIPDASAVPLWEWRPYIPDHLAWVRGDNTSNVIFWSDGIDLMYEVMSYRTDAFFEGWKRASNYCGRWYLDLAMSDTLTFGTSHPEDIREVRAVIDEVPRTRHLLGKTHHEWMGYLSRAAAFAVGPSIGSQPLWPRLEGLAMGVPSIIPHRSDYWIPGDYPFSAREETPEEYEGILRLAYDYVVGMDAKLRICLDRISAEVRESYSEANSLRMLDELVPVWEAMKGSQ